MPAPVIVRGHANFKEIEDAFDSVRRKVAKFNEQVVKDSAKSGTARVRTEEKTAKEIASVRRAEEAANTKVALDGAKTRNKIVLDSAKSAHKINVENSKAANRLKLEEFKAHEKVERDKTKVTKQEVQARKVVEDKSVRDIQRKASSRASGVTSAIGRAGRSTYGTVMGVAGTMGLAGGGMMIGNAVMGGLNLQRQAALLSNSTSTGGKAGATPAELIAKARETAAATGFGATNVMESMSTVAARGGPEALKVFKNDLADVAKTAIASGTSIEDMGAVYAAAFKAGVTPGKEMQQLMLDLVSQGKEGAVEFADLAQELAKLAGAGKSWGGGADMIRRASGLAQIAVEAAVSPEESRTAVVDMVREFSQGPKIQALKNAGIKVEGAGGKNRDPAQLLADVIDRAETKGIGSKGYKGQAALSEIFTGKSQEAIVRNLRETYLNGYKSDRTGRNYTGKEAVSQRILDSSSSTMTREQRDSEFQKVMGTDVQKIAVAMEKFGGEMDKLLPKISEMIPTITAMTEKLAGVVTWAASNPFTAVVSLLGASLLKEAVGSVASAGIGAAVKQALLASMGGGVPVPPGGGVGAGGKVIGAAAAGVAGFGLGTALAETVDASGTSTGKSAYATRMAAENLLHNKDATKEQLLSAAAQVKKTEDVGKFGTHVYDYAGPIGIGAGAIRAISEKSSVQGSMDPAKLQAALEAAASKLSAAGDKLGSANLPNQSGAPTSTTPTKPTMK